MEIFINWRIIAVNNIILRYVYILRCFFSLIPESTDISLTVLGDMVPQRGELALLTNISESSISSLTGSDFFLFHDLATEVLGVERAAIVTPETIKFINVIRELHNQNLKHHLI